MAEPARGGAAPGAERRSLRSAGDGAEPAEGRSRAPTDRDAASAPLLRSGGWCGGVSPPDFPPGAKASGPPCRWGDPALAQNADLLRGVKPPETGCGATCAKGAFCVGAGGRGRRGGWGPDGPGWGAAPTCTEGAGRLGEPGSPSGPRMKTGSAPPVTGEESQRGELRFTSELARG